MESIEIKRKKITKGQFIEFLKSSDLGKQYPKENFEKRISKLVKNIDISLLALNSRNRIVGICFGLTDYAYWLHITDLGVSRDYLKMGIGKTMIKKALELAGGKENIIMFAYANENAIPFYKKIGMVETKHMMKYSKIKWTNFEVN